MDGIGAEWSRPRWAGPRVGRDDRRDAQMGRLARSISWVLLAAPAFSPDLCRACTSIVVSRGASKDGSVMVTYSADAPFMPRLLRVPGGEHPAGSMVDVRGWEDEQIRGQVRQARRTYTVVGLMNEHQLAL